MRVGYRHRNDLGQRAAAYFDVAGRLPQPSSVAIRAGCISSVFREENSNVQFVFLCFEPLKETGNAAPPFVAMDDIILLEIGQVGEWSVDVYPSVRRISQ